MSKPSPIETVRAMVTAAQAAETPEDLATPGTYAGQYGDAVKDDLNADNVEAFTHGAAVVNLLIQEAILRVTTVARLSLPESESLVEATYIEGCKDGALLIAQIMAATADGIIQGMIEGPAIERAFDQIVSNF